MKILSDQLPLPLIALFFFTLLSPARGDENEIRQTLERRYPNKGKIEHILKTPYSGLYEVLIGDQLIYSDERGQYLFDGSVIEVKSGSNLTEDRHSQLVPIKFDKLPLDIAIKKVKGDGSRKMAMFTDPNCPYCKRLEKDLAQLSDVTLYIYLYPIFPNSAEIVANVQCAPDPAKAWDEYMINGVTPANARCDTHTDKVISLGRKLRIKTTPTLIFANGTSAPGYLPVEELEKRFGQAKIIR